MTSYNISDLNQRMLGWLQALRDDLKVDAVGMFQIINPATRSEFDLKGEALANWVKISILSLLNEGAKPVRGARDPATGLGYRVEQLQYGTDHDKIADAIIAEWLGWGGGDPDHGGLWFTTPDDIGLPPPDIMQERLRRRDELIRRAMRQRD